MRLTDAVIPLFEYPIGDILSALPEESSPEWDKMRFRQGTFDAHQRTRSIVYRWLDNSWEPGQPFLVLKSDFAAAELSSAVEACASRLVDRLPGTIVKLMLAELAPGGVIPQHIDKRPALVHAHRCHVPIVSNKDVKFFVDGKPFYLVPGIAYEFDNTRKHGVANRSSTRRVHLICDIIPPEVS